MKKAEIINETRLEFLTQFDALFIEVSKQVQATGLPNEDCRKEFNDSIGTLLAFKNLQDAKHVSGKLNELFEAAYENQGDDDEFTALNKFYYLEELVALITIIEKIIEILSLEDAGLEDQKKFKKRLDEIYENLKSEIVHLSYNLDDPDFDNSIVEYIKDYTDLMVKALMHGNLEQITDVECEAASLMRELKRCFYDRFSTKDDPKLTFTDLYKRQIPVEQVRRAIRMVFQVGVNHDFVTSAAWAMDYGDTIEPIVDYFDENDRLVLATLSKNSNHHAHWGELKKAVPSFTDHTIRFLDRLELIHGSCRFGYQITPKGLTISKYFEAEE